MITVDVNADTISPYTGKRITTVVATYPRFIHAEVMTHRMFSRNSASSRAIPVAKTIQRIMDEPVLPVQWGRNQSGMQDAGPVDAQTAEFAELVWKDAAWCMKGHAEQLMNSGIHKQIANRLLEPFMWTTTIITATEWENFYRLRCDPAAQPEFQKLAYMIRDAIAASTPRRQPIHIPFGLNVPDDLSVYEMIKVATGRVARVSYLTHDGFRDVIKDLELHDRLLSDQHMSPFEHCAFAMPDAAGWRCGNFKGWCQYRHAVDWPANWDDTDHHPYGLTYCEDMVPG